MGKFTMSDDDLKIGSSVTPLCQSCTHSGVCHFLFALAEIGEAGVVAIVTTCAHYGSRD